MYLGFSFFLSVYIISCILVIIATYISFKLDDTVDHTLYGLFDEEIYRFFILMAFVPLANTVVAFAGIIFVLGMLYYCSIHEIIVKICKKIKI